MRVLLEVGAANILDYAARFGFDTSTFPRNTQLAIGGGTMAVTPLEMVNAYAVFANGGWRVQPHIVSQVLDLNGKVIFEPRYPEVCAACPQPAPGPNQASEPDAEPGSLEELLAGGTEPSIVPAERVIDERIAYIMTSMLKDVIRRGTGTRARSLERDDLAGKTGTTNEAADTWFNGFNPSIVTTVWVGFPSHSPLGRREYGSNNPLPIWIEYMQVALREIPEETLPVPAGVVTIKIDPRTGRVASPTQQDAIFEYFLQEHAPQPEPTSGLQPDRPEDDLTPVDIF
jgi:penicillin-binding protein 1A